MFLFCVLDDFTQTVTAKDEALSIVTVLGIVGGMYTCVYL